MTLDELCGPNWLLCYQAYENGWLPSVDGSDYIKQDSVFSFLRTHNVKFYDVQSSNKYSIVPVPRPMPPVIYTGGY